MPRNVHSMLAFAHVVVRLKLVYWGERPPLPADAAQIESRHAFVVAWQQRTPATSDEDVAGHTPVFV